MNQPILSARRELEEFRQRYKWMALVAVIAFGIIFGRAFQLQIVDVQQYRNIATNNITKTVWLPATRGLIYDTRGRVIATNRPAYNALITPQYLVGDDLTRFIELMKLTPEEATALRNRLASLPPQRMSQQIEMFRDITTDRRDALETHSLELAGVDVIDEPRRLYPFSSLAAHAIGYLNEVNADDVRANAGLDYRPGDRIGRSGIERAWEGYLRGRRGFYKVLVDVRRRVQQGSQTERREPMPGSNITLTLDMELMRIVEHAFRGHPSGGVVAVDPRNGSVRALYSKPSYDLNEISGRLSVARAAEIQENPFRPLIDKTIFESYFPGSTFKPLAALAALGHGVRTPDDHIECIGHYEIGRERKRCTKRHGEVDLRSSLVQSCNVYFYDLAYSTGLDTLNETANAFGLGERSGIGINTETQGFIPTRQWYIDHYENFRPGFTLNEAIGQGNMRVTLIQLAMVYAALANGGTLFAPRLVESVAPVEGPKAEFAPRERRRISMRSDHMALITDGLIGVVNDPTGTAYDANVGTELTIAGKTGTAQVSRQGVTNDPTREFLNHDHAWFAGFAPARDPELVVVVLVEHGGGGGKNAAPIAIEILREYFRLRRGRS